VDNQPLMTIGQVEQKQRIKNAVYDVLGRTSYYSGLTWARRACQPGPLLRVLIYYKVNSLRGNTLSISPEIFARQLRFLKEHYRVVSPSQVKDFMVNGTALPNNAVLLTFDDGYRDVFESAYPILKELKLEAVLFPATDYIGANRPFPHDERLPMANPVLNWDQIRGMMDVFTVGSHTKSHRILTAMPLHEAKEEIVSSKALIEDRLGRVVEFFSYPKGASGHFNQALEDTVQAAGYLASFVTLTGPNPSDHVSGGKWLRRYMVEPFSDFTFARLLDGSCDAIGLKDTSWGVLSKRTFNRFMRTATR
jgi:peptidoglycan/xylan/chitin deacetylase (PgdA/CDA1 family)